MFGTSRKIEHCVECPDGLHFTFITGNVRKKFNIIQRSGRIFDIFNIIFVCLNRQRATKGGAVLILVLPSFLSFIEINIQL